MERLQHLALISTPQMPLHRCRHRCLRRGLASAQAGKQRSSRSLQLLMKTRMRLKKIGLVLRVRWLLSAAVILQARLVNPRLMVWKPPLAGRRRQWLRPLRAW